MNTYQITFAHSVQCYGTLEIEATSDETVMAQMIEALKKYQRKEPSVLDNCVTDPEYDTADEFRVTIDNIETRETVAEDIKVNAEQLELEL